MQMLVKGKILCWLFLILLGNKAVAQDIHFSQFFEAPLLRNPALAGLFDGDVRVQAVYRDQWNSIANAYRSGSLNAEYKMPVGAGDNFMTLGVQSLFNKAGTIGWKSSHILPAVVYHQSMREDKSSYLSIGFMGGYVQQQFDRSKMITDNQYNGGPDGESLPSTAYGYWDGAVGMSYNSSLFNETNHFYVGLGYHHFNKPKASFYNHPSLVVSPKWVLSTALRFNLNDFTYMTFFADYTKQNSYQEVVGGAFYGLKLSEESPVTVHGGLFLRVNDAVIPVIKLDYNDVTFSMSYDVSTSPLKVSNYGRGGYELGITYKGFLDRANTTLNALKCPKF